MPTIPQHLRRHRRALLWSGGLLVLYSLIGFLIVPWLVERQLVNTLQQRLQLATQVESIYFNPYSFYFEVRSLQVSEDGSGELLSLGDLHLNFEASRVFLLKLQFAEVSVTDLDFYFARQSELENTLFTLGERWTSSAEPVVQTAPDESDDIIPLQIGSLNFSNIHLHVTDAVPITPFETTLRLTSAQIDDVSTLAGERGANALEINFEEGARLDWQGGFSVNPLDFNGEMA